MKSSDKIPFTVHEADMARLSLSVKRLWITVAVLIAVCAITNIAWILHEDKLAGDFETAITTFNGCG